MLSSISSAQAAVNRGSALSSGLKANTTASSQQRRHDVRDQTAFEQFLDTANLFWVAAFTDMFGKGLAVRASWNSLHGTRGEVRVQRLQKLARVFETCFYWLMVLPLTEALASPLRHLARSLELVDSRHADKLAQLVAGLASLLIATGFNEWARHRYLNPPLMKILRNGSNLPLIGKLCRSA